MTGLEPAEIAALLQAGVTALRTEVSTLPKMVATWHPAEGEWCALDVVGHLIEAERRGFAGRIRAILARPDVELDGWDPAEVSRARGDCRRDAADLVAELAALREESAALVTRLRPEELTCGGRHPKVGYLRVSDLLQEWVHHDRNHLKQIMTNVQGYVWPAMGNAQRFSAP